LIRVLSCLSAAEFSEVILPRGPAVGVLFQQKSNRITAFCQARKAWHPYEPADIGWAAFRPAAPVRRYCPIFLKLFSSHSSPNPIT
jgi:hypothetical protein